jgi:hypothetical protein
MTFALVACGPPSEEIPYSVIIPGGAVVVPTEAEPVCASRPALTIQDCASMVSTYTRPEQEGPELVVLGIHESRGDYSPGFHPEGTATVQVRRTRPHILVLSSYEPTLWRLEVGPGARLEGIILNGYYAQRVEGVPSGVSVTNRSGQAALSACAYVWPASSSGQACDTQKLVAGLRQLTSREVTAFAGCYRATGFTVADEPGECASSAPVTHQANCALGSAGLSTHVSSERSAPELHLLGVHAAPSGSSVGQPAEGATTVDVTRTAPLILALSSYEPIHWTVRPAPGARIQQIIVNGFYAQRVTAPAGIPIVNRSGSQWLGASAYAWQSTSGGNDTPRLVTALEQLTSRPLSSFAGCYRATSFTLGQ